MRERDTTKKRRNAFALMLILSLSLVLAMIFGITSGKAYADQTRVFDDADILSTNEERKLNSRVNEIIDKYDL
ncbi:MAG: hypothetical protein IJL97_01990, partial [Lachnospiraceae bacterium]|nr:hypothetical protein [Lachnospiraceae bacterium]